MLASRSLLRAPGVTARFHRGSKHSRGNCATLPLAAASYDGGSGITSHSRSRSPSSLGRGDAQQAALAGVITGGLDWIASHAPGVAEEAVKEGFKLIFDELLKTLLIVNWVLMLQQAQQQAPDGGVSEQDGSSGGQPEGGSVPPAGADGSSGGQPEGGSVPLASSAQGAERSTASEVAPEVPAAAAGSTPPSGGTRSCQMMVWDEAAGTVLVRMRGMVTGSEEPAAHVAALEQRVAELTQALEQAEYLIEVQKKTIYLLEEKEAAADAGL